MMAGALVLPETNVGMMEASATRSPRKPRTRSRSSTTALASLPILHVPTGWNTVAPPRRQKSSTSSSVCTSSPG